MKVGSVIVEEWKNIVKDRRLFAILFLIPIAYTVMFGYIYVNHKVTEMNTVIFDADQSQLSRQIIQAFDQHETFKVVGEKDTEESVKQALSEGSAKVGIIIPAGLESKLKHGDTPPVLALVDGSNMLISNGATRGANEVISTFSAGVTMKKLQQQGLQDEQISSTLAAIPFRYRVMYNPTFNYSDFMIYGLIGAILQQVLLLGIALAVTRDKEQGTWDRFREWMHNPWRIAYAKSAPYLLIGLLNATIALLIALYWFHLPFHGAAVAMLLLVAGFTFAVLGIGYLVSLISGSQLASTQTAMLIAVPSFLLSGFTWPFEAMPSGLATAGKLLPLTYFLDGVRNVMVKGNDLTSVYRDCVVLGLMGLVTYFVSFLLTRFVVFRKKSSAEPAAAVDSTLAV
ncbi:ABC transporter permease [Paenibacillus sp. GD4]|uniref:ABC transporter permease n=1 Tax=Paenibacillus sp. GD4 TaxID=3068890 RepID=UPI00279666AC|nr:ABC transporter permease [Paenibacillus sp. GD4]MDQ1909897.1 ABC transporter permease [Paenibacillus sp. GD4]